MFNLRATISDMVDEIIYNNWVVWLALFSKYHIHDNARTQPRFRLAAVKLALLHSFHLQSVWCSTERLWCFEVCFGYLCVLTESDFGCLCQFTVQRTISRALWRLVRGLPDDDTCYMHETYSRLADIWWTSFVRVKLVASDFHIH